jgi:hypothetical protein
MFSSNKYSGIWYGRIELNFVEDEELKVKP